MSRKEIGSNISRGFFAKKLKGLASPSDGHEVFEKFVQHRHEVKRRFSHQKGRLPHGVNSLILKTCTDSGKRQFSSIVINVPEGMKYRELAHIDSDHASNLPTLNVALRAVLSGSPVPVILSSVRTSSIYPIFDFLYLRVRNEGTALWHACGCPAYACAQINNKIGLAPLAIANHFRLD
jgi:hypothetical protein